MGHLSAGFWLRRKPGCASASLCARWPPNEQKKGRPTDQSQKHSSREYQRHRTTRSPFGAPAAGPIDTFTAIRELNIVRPGARINELRDMGHRIMTERLTLTDDQGRTHRGMALYYLSTNPPAGGTA
ncbi:helix-turn-helix domain-containing protein [Pseudomonas sp. NPDC085632]|uniref:helix-turn-helix domain-containing protein n=1 Tax=Pseudomonas sp. NPDC085632 TaxID=3364429 RepID=UPI0037CC72D7